MQSQHVRRRSGEVVAGAEPYTYTLLHGTGIMLPSC